MTAHTMIAAGVTAYGERFSLEVRGYKVSPSMVELDCVGCGGVTIFREEPIIVTYPGGGCEVISPVELVDGKFAICARH